MSISCRGGFFTSAANRLIRVQSVGSLRYQHPNFVCESGQGTEAAQRTLELTQDAQRNLEQNWASRSGASGASAGAASASGAAASGGASGAATSPEVATTPAPTAQAARPWAKAPPGTPAPWLSMTRDISEEPQPVQVPQLAATVLCCPVLSNCSLASKDNYSIIC